MSAALRTVVGARTSDFDRLVALAAEDGKDCYRPGWRFTGSASFARLKSLPDAVFRSTLLQALHARLLKRTPHAEASVPTPTPHEIARVLGACLAHFARTACEWELEQVTAVLEATARLPFDSYTNVDEYRFAIGLAEQRNRVSPLPANSVVALVELRENLTRQGDVAMSGGTSNDVNSLNARLLALIPAGDDVFGGIALAESDPFGKAATVALRSLVGTDGLGTALAHLVRPPGSGAWKAEVRRRADILGALARTLIGLLATTELSSSWMLAASSVALVKGAAATLAEIGGSDDAALLEQAAVATAFLAQGLYAAGAPPRACIGALGQMSVSEGHEGLVRLQALFRSGDLKKRVAAALDDVATRSGVSPGELIERAVGDHDLGPQHELTIGTAVLAAELRVTRARRRLDMARRRPTCSCRRRTTRGVFLPFDGDDLLSVVLSKAALLAADDRITDESILRQIR